MRFFFNPIIFIYELIAFAIQAVVAYGILLILVFGLLIYGISTMPKEPDKIIEYVNIEPEEEAWGGVCKKVSGCAVNNDGRTPEEYCPTCIHKKRSFSSIDKVADEDDGRPNMKEPLEALKQ